MINKILVSLFILCLSVTAEARDKEPYCIWKTGITESRLEIADNALLSETKSSDDAAIQAAIAEHLPFGMPTHTATDSEHLLAQPDFIIWYDNDLRDPLWTAHHLTNAEADADRKRLDSFRSDPRLKATWSRSECADYKEPIFDQGHMVPRADMNHSEIAMDQTFLMSNMTPQHCAFNRGVWQVLEALGRKWAEDTPNTWIISGTIFDRDGEQGRDPDQIAWRMSGKYGMRVAIPSHQYKIFVRQTDTGWTVLPFILPNTDTHIPKDQLKQYLQDHIVSLNNIAERSGFSFFSDQTVTEETELWSFTGNMPSQLTWGCKDSYPDY